MPSLPELQHGFARAVLDAAACDAALFRGSLDLSLGRVAVYRGNLHANAAKALAGAYPVVRKIVGEEFFDATVREFARRHPSLHGDLNRYGERFAEFLERFPHTADLAYLPDVARMEWLVHRAYFAADPAPFDLSGLDERALLRPKLAPACALMQSAWPLARIWTIHQDGHQGGFEIDLAAGPDRILVHRPRWRATVVSLSCGDYAFLNSAYRGKTLAEALEAGDTDEHFDPATALARWLEARVFARLV
jgi:hypothetical protein